jgi:hypothetical protein
MIRRNSLLILVGSLLPILCAAQNTPSSTASMTNQESTAPTGGPSSAPATKTEKTKKIWTNDEMGSLQGTVSVVGTNRPGEGSGKTSASGTHGAVDPRRGKILRYRAAIAELQKKIDAGDERITQLKNFKADDSSPNGGINPNRGYNMIPVDEQVKQLEAKKKQLLASIEDLENQAKKEGIEPGELR